MSAPLHHRAIRELIPEKEGENRHTPVLLD
ncbi:hypothetical protein SAMN05428961_110118 [Paenibacillus sp. OK060]|nr:hypothetical protein SAMN05428961_110118 [Paenibacillus sp. OK060]